MEYFLSLLEAAALGMVQGLTEFLPVSSSAHLTIVPWLFHWETPGMVFDTSLHLGTALALLIFFHKDFWNMTLSIFAPKKIKHGAEREAYRKITFGVLLAIVPIALVGLSVEKPIEWFFSPEMLPTSIFVVSSMLVLFGLFLWLADIYGKKDKNITDLPFAQMILIGIMQICALVPGVSRSGSTMIAGLLLGLKREEAARFSFLLGTPVIILAGLFKLKDLVGISMTPQMIGYFCTGVLFSALSGYFVIRFFLAFLKKYPLTPFVVYRGILGLVITFVALM